MGAVLSPSKQQGPQHIPLTPFWGKDGRRVELVETMGAITLLFPHFWERTGAVLSLSKQWGRQNARQIGDCFQIGLIV